jgi:hypothetical protein
MAPDFFGQRIEFSLIEPDFAATLSLQGEVKAKRYFLAFVLASFPG